MTVVEIIDKQERRIRDWLNQLKSFRSSTPLYMTEKKGEESIENHVNVAAYYLAMESRSYEHLVWILAEKILKQTEVTPTREDIEKKAEELSSLSKTYDELCYLNAELDILSKKKS